MYIEYEMSFWVDAVSHFSVNENLSVLLTHHSVKNTHKTKQTNVSLSWLLFWCFFSGLQDLRKAGLLIFANKQDVKGCMSVAEISQSLQLTSVKDHQWHIQACCALTGEGWGYKLVIWENLIYVCIKWLYSICFNAGKMWWRVRLTKQGKLTWA